MNDFSLFYLDHSSPSRGRVPYKQTLTKHYSNSPHQRRAAWSRNGKNL